MVPVIVALACLTSCGGGHDGVRWGDGGPLTRCGDDWVDLQTDLYHCGTCNRVCLVDGYEYCKAGQCGSTNPCYLPHECDCPPGQLMCDTQAHECADVTSDVQHCGACDRTCGDGQTCAGGHCVPCALGSTSCQCASVSSCGAGLACLGRECVATCDAAAPAAAACPTGQACTVGAEVAGVRHDLCRPHPLEGSPCGGDYGDCGGSATTCVVVAGGAAGSYCLRSCSDVAACCGDSAPCLATAACVGGSCVPSDPAGPHAACAAVCRSTLDAAGAVGLCDFCATGAGIRGELCATAFAEHLCTQLDLVCPLLELAALDCATLDCDWYCSAVGW